MKKVKTNKLLAYLLLAALLFSSLAPLSQLAFADNGGNEEQIPEQPVEEEYLTTVNITKVETAEVAKDMTLEQLKNGLLPGSDEWITAFGEDVEGLDGIYFTVYRVSEEDFAELMEEKPSTAGAVTALVTPEWSEEIGPTNNGGKVSVTLDEGYYWFIENPNPLVTSSAAVPFGLELPFTNLEGDGYLTSINVYPKNVLDDDEPEIDKVVDKEHNDIGEVHTWTVGLTIPNGIEAYEKFGFIDEIDSRLDWVDVNTVVVSAPCIVGEPEDPDSGLKLDVDYTVEFEAGGVGTYGETEGKDITGTLKVFFTESGRAKLAENECERIEVSFDTIINDTAIMGQDIPNRPGLVFDNGFGNIADPDDPENPPKEPEGPDPVVNTGGKAFIKKSNELGPEMEPVLLEGAEFVIKNLEGKYVQRNETNGYITFVDDKADATVFTSDASGKFEIKGLEYGEYVLEEIKAPSGFALPTNPETEFEVTENSYYLEPEDVTTTETESDNPLDVVNRKLTIPQTGGMGTLIFTLLGGILMVGSVIYYRRTKLN